MTKDEFIDIWCANAELVQTRMSPVAREHAKALNRQVAAYEWAKRQNDLQGMTPEEFLRQKTREQKKTNW